MEKNIILEIKRISELMVISENAQTEFALWLKNLVKSDEQLIKNSLSTVDRESTKAINKILNNENIDDILLNKLIKNINWGKIATNIIDNKVLGSEFAKQLESAVTIVAKNPEKETQMLNKFYTGIDNVPFLSDAPTQLKNSLKSSVKSKIETGSSSLRSKIASNLNTSIGELQTIVSNFENKNSNQIAKDAGLKSHLKMAKELIKDISAKDVQILSKSAQSDLKAIEAVIKQKSPNLMNYLNKYVSNFGLLPKWAKVIALLIGIALIGGKNTGVLLNTIAKNCSSWVQNFIKGLTRDNSSSQEGGGTQI
jgi:hypothetical protein